jgi:tetratricopeptide (TPR) repeat protein
MTIKVVTRLLVGLVLLANAACHPKPREITPLERKTAANFVSEAQFAVTVRDHVRAADLYEKAAALCPDTAEYWLGLGGSRRQLEQRPAAQKAYEAALGVYRDAYARDGKDPQPLLAQVYVLALLGRVDDARATLAKVRSSHGDSPMIRNFTDQSFNQMLADPGFKANAL